MEDRLFQNLPNVSSWLLKHLPLWINTRSKPWVEKNIFYVKEKKEAQRKWQMDYYYRNKETILKKMKEKYRQKKLNLSKHNLRKTSWRTIAL